MVKHLAFIVAFSIAASPALAQTMGEVQARRGSSAYLQDERGVVVRSPFGLCWHSGTWSTADAVIGCDGRLASPIANPTAPEPALPATPPQTQTAVAPAPVPCDFTVTLGNDESFEFNKAALGKSARKRIDEQVIGRLSTCAAMERLTVRGYADRLGAQQYNQRLSEKRAGAVADYLKDKTNFEKIEILGLGETQSTTSCGKRLPRRALIDCLAPDRRVVIEIQGIAE